MIHDIKALINPIHLYHIPCLDHELYFVHYSEFVESLLNLYGFVESDKYDDPNTVVCYHNDRYYPDWNKPTVIILIGDERLLIQQLNDYVDIIQIPKSLEDINKLFGAINND